MAPCSAARRDITVKIVVPTAGNFDTSGDVSMRADE